MSYEEMRKDLEETFHRLKENQGEHGKLHNPGDLHKCVSIEDTEEGNIRISFKKEKGGCEPLKDRYKEILDLAIKGGETIYTSL